MPVRVEYRLVEISSEEETNPGLQLVEVGPQARGWLAAKYCIFPQSVVLALNTRTTLEKIQIMGHPWAVTSKVTII